MSRKGSKHTIETRAKMSAARMGNKNSLGCRHTPEARAKMSTAMAGEKNPFYGRKHTEETCAKIAAAHLGRKASAEARAKMSAMRGGNQNGNWKGGRRTNDDGYICLLQHDHPACDSLGYILEHRLAMEAVLGRMLLPTEIVHHMPPGIKDDNRPENLALCNNDSAHAAIHSGEIYLPV